MSKFDPWTATLDEAMAAEEATPGDFFDPDRPLARWNSAQHVMALRPAVDAGIGSSVMDATARCVRRGLVMPDWLASAFLRRYDAVLNCRIGTWDEAFGAAQPRGKHLSTLRLHRMFGARVQRLFDGPNRLPRTLAGRQEAARQLGITEKQVRTLLPKTRTNVRGHKPYREAVQPAVGANDPFALARR